MKFVFLLTSIIVLTACNTYGTGINHAVNQQQPVGSQNQYVPVIISDESDTNSAPAVSLCTREPYTTYTNSPNYCNYAPIIQP